MVTLPYRRPQCQQYAYNPFFSIVPIYHPCEYRPFLNTLFDPLDYIYFYDDSDDDEEPKKEEPKEETEDNQPTENKPLSYSKIWTIYSRGGVEEVCEKTYDGRSGNTLEFHTRRIGDRWCRIETTTSKDGQSVNKET